MKKKAFIKLAKCYINEHFKSLTACAEHYRISRAYLYLCLSGKREFHMDIVEDMGYERSKVSYYEYKKIDLPAALKEQAS